MRVLAADTRTIALTCPPSEGSDSDRVSKAEADAHAQTLSQAISLMKIFAASPGWPKVLDAYRGAKAKQMQLAFEEFLDGSQTMKAGGSKPGSMDGQLKSLRRMMAVRRIQRWWRPRCVATFLDEFGF